MLERLAQWTEAANAYILAGDACLRLRDISQAVELWQKAALLDRRTCVRAKIWSEPIALRARRGWLPASTSPWRVCKLGRAGWKKLRSTARLRWSSIRTALRLRKC